MKSAKIAKFISSSVCRPCSTHTSSRTVPMFLPRKGYVPVRTFPKDTGTVRDDVRMREGCAHKVRPALCRGEASGRMPVEERTGKSSRCFAHPHDRGPFHPLKMFHAVSECLNLIVAFAGWILLVKIGLYKTLYTLDE